MLERRKKQKKILFSLRFLCCLAISLSAESVSQSDGKSLPVLAKKKRAEKRHVMETSHILPSGNSISAISVESDVTIKLFFLGIAYAQCW